METRMQKDLETGFPGVTDSSATRVESVSTGIQKELDPSSQETLRHQPATLKRQRGESCQVFRRVRETSRETAANKKRLIIVISGPSGCGKTSVIEKLLTLDSHLRVAISATTRPKRPLEEDGKDYYFMTEAEFKTHNFAEQAEVYGHYYGTLKSEIEHLRQEGCDILFNKDYQGLQNLKKHYDVISIFIKPPSLEILAQRLTARKQDSKEVIQKRLAEAERTLQEAMHYDHVVVNDDLDTCVQEIYHLICHSGCHPREGGNDD